MIRILWGFLRRDLQQEMSYKLSFAMQVLGILPMLVLFILLSRFFGNAVAGQLAAYGGRYFPFVLIGLAVQTYLSQALSAFSGRLREAQLTGTFEAELATTAPLPLHLAGMALYPFALGTFHVFIILATGSLMGGVHFHWNRLPQVALVLLVSAGAFACLGVLSISYIVVFKRGDPVGFLVRICSWMLGGVYFPAAVLPVWLRRLADGVPMTHCLEALRCLLLRNEGMGGILRPLAFLALWALLGLPLAYGCFRAAVGWARRKGSLGQY
jgi:ABC-2 type transport system permease protein